MLMLIQLGIRIVLLTQPKRKSPCTPGVWRRTSIAQQRSSGDSVVVWGEVSQPDRNNGVAICHTLSETRA